LFLGNWRILRLWTMARARVMVLNSRQKLFLDDIFVEIKNNSGFSKKHLAYRVELEGNR